MGINRRMPREFDGLKFGFAPPAGGARCWEPNPPVVGSNQSNSCINDIVIRLFPASAGMNRLLASSPVPRRPVPRKRGDEPAQYLAKPYLFTFPRKRGDEPVAGLNRSKLKLSKWAEEYERGQGKIRCPQRERNHARRYQRRASPLSCGTPSPLRYMKPRSNCAAASPSVARLRNPATSGAFWQLTSATTVNGQMQHDAATSRRCRCPMRPNPSEKQKILPIEGEASEE